MTDLQPCQKVLGNEHLKADLDGSLKRMQMRQSNRNPICLVKMYFKYQMGCVIIKKRSINLVKFKE